MVDDLDKSVPGRFIMMVFGGMPVDLALLLDLDL